MSPTSCHCSTPRTASHRGEAVILGASNRPRQADGGALLEAAASLGFDIPLDVEQALFAGLQKLGELLLEDRVGALRQLALSPAAAAVRARQDGCGHSDWTVRHGRLLQRQIHLPVGHVHVEDLDFDLVVHLHVVVDIANVLVRDLRNMNQSCPRSLDLYECPEVRYPADRPNAINSSTNSRFFRLRRRRLAYRLIASGSVPPKGLPIQRPPLSPSRLA